MENELEKLGASSQVYEVGFHLIPTIAESDLGVEVTAMRDRIETAGGMVIADEYPKHMELAYPMVKIVANKRTTYNSAYFGWMKFDAQPKIILAIEEALKQGPSVIRFLLIKTVRESTLAPKKVLQQKRSETIERTHENIVEKPELTEEELDKTIEGLVIS